MMIMFYAFIRERDIGPTDERTNERKNSRTDGRTAAAANQNILYLFAMAPPPTIISISINRQ